MAARVNVLADACALIAFHAGPSTNGPAPLSAEALRVMAEEQVQVSPITVFEITQKVALGKLPPLPIGGLSFAGWLTMQGYEPAPFTWQETEAANQLPWYHKDPFDRLLVATALRHDAVVVTCDAIFAAYGVRNLW